MRALLTFTTVLCIAISSLALAADKYDPYFIEKRALKKEYKRIALAPVESGASLAMPESAKQAIEKQITQHLKKRGYIVIPSSILADIRKTMVDQVGGFRDPNTGEIDAAKVSAVRDHSWRELWFRHDFDAVATTRVAIINAPIENDKAEWDGVSQKVKKKGRGLKYTATVAASTVTLSIYDERERPLYVNYGGLEVLMMREKTEFKPLDPSTFFQDEKRIRKAVSIAVKPI
ncbi:MAG: hypothetical protein AB8B57_07455 [Congregibacter sp.]